MIDDEAKPLVSVAYLRLGKAIKRIAKAWVRYVMTKRVENDANAYLYNAVETACFIYCIDMSEFVAMCKDVVEVADQSKAGDYGERNK